MTPERWQHVTQVYEAALEREPEARAAFLADACGTDADLRREVDSLLAHDATPVLVDSSIWDVVGGLLEVDAGLALGSVAGHYRIDAVVGAGGMGQVYRARDMTLQRDVALKILPALLADDEEFLERFRREAQVLASLNHPAIATIYGFEALGRVHALVLELVEGPTLADRLRRGAISMDEAVPIADQIARALEAAHQQAIIHRDLKPANVKVTNGGSVKLLDFGLAKPIAELPEGPEIERERLAEQAPRSPTSVAPTVTGAGAVLGTAAYMSPEQVKGRALDIRSDIWSFGCVLYEMLTGKAAFPGADVDATFAAVMKNEPDWAALPSEVPDAIRRLLARCLAKDRRHRIADAAIVRYVLADVTQAPRTEHIAPSGRPISRVAVVLASAVATLLGLGLGVGWMVLHGPSHSSAVTRLPVLTPASPPLTFHGINRDVAISPDGRMVVYRAGTPTRWQLVAQSLDQLDPRPLANTDVGNTPFFSPDSQWLGFAGGARLWKIPVAGGAATVLCRIAGASSRGATWGPDRTIYFADSDPAVGLLSIPESGGTPQTLTRPDRDKGERDHWFPYALPNGRGVLFTIAGERPESALVAVLDLRSRTHKTLVPGSDARYVDSGHLVYVAAGGLRAVRFDPAALEVIGEPVPIPDQVMTLRSGIGNFSIARDGTLLYVARTTGAAAWPLRSLVWVDRSGREEPIPAEPRAFISARLSRDRTQLALEIRDGDPAIWIFDIGRKLLQRLNSDSYSERNPVWTADGRLLFASDRSGVFNVYRQWPSAGSSTEQLTSNSWHLFPSSLSRDAARLFVTQLSPDADVMVFHEPDRRTERLIARANSPEISPDGRWVAYKTYVPLASGTVGTPAPFPWAVGFQSEVFVQPFPGTDGQRTRISVDGGSHPAWSADGSELFFFDRQGRLTSIAFHPTRSGLKLGEARVLLQPKYFADAGPAPSRPYDVVADGRFIMIKDNTPNSAQRPGPSLIVVQNWIEELKRLAPR
jgi:eukaryotic-like serine/threonine-protein kinase